MKPFLLVAADFVPTGGMDMANLALARYLAEQGREVHLVTHRVAEELTTHRNVVIHRVPKIANSYFLSSPLVDRVGRYWAKKISARGGRVLVNGGNCQWADANWVHYLHAAYRRQPSGNRLRRLKKYINHQLDVAEERNALKQARVVIANSKRTKEDIIERLDIPPQRIHTIYYGIDTNLFHPVTPDERAAARSGLGWLNGNLTVVFLGALGDRRKGFDTLFAAWKSLCADPQWDVDLAIVGTGAELPMWTSRAAQDGLASRMKFLGFRSDVPMILKASDALIAPTRYEAYGLGVHEALSCGLPSLVTRTSGVAERYPAELQELLIADSDSPGELEHSLRHWRSHMGRIRQVVEHSLAHSLRSHTWEMMAAQIVRVIEDN